MERRARTWLKAFLGSIAPLVAAGVWDATPMQTELLVQLDRPVGGGDDVRVIDDIAIPKKGGRRCAVCFALGKTANCQTLVNRPCWREIYPADMRMIWPVAGPGRPRQKHVAHILSIPSEDVAGQRQMAHHQLAHRHEGKLKACSLSGCGSPTHDHSASGTKASTYPGGLAYVHPCSARGFSLGSRGQVGSGNF